MLSIEQELKVSRMAKRSQNRKLFGRDNYRLREFVLQTYCIRYFEVSGGNRGKEKGQLLLSNVKFIEKVQDDDLDNKQNVFQIGYAEHTLSTAWYVIYIVANSANERDDWINLVRFFTRERGAHFVPKYHPGVWKRPGRFTCCDDINCRSIGCQMTTEPGPPVSFDQTPRSPTGLMNDPQTNSFDPTFSSNPTQLPNITSIAPPNGTAVPQISCTPDILTQPLQSISVNPPSLSIPPHSLPMSTQILHPSHIPSLVSSTPPSNLIMPSTMGPPTASALFQLQQQAMLDQKHQHHPLALLNPTPFSQPNNGLSRPTQKQIPKPTISPMQQQQQHQFFDMDESENTVIAVHNYNPVRENQLPLQKGEKYYVVNQSNAQWWYVRNMVGQLGYVPTNYVHKPNSLSSFDWYYKNITRQQAEAILLEEGREGCFLVRDSVSKKNTYTLSVTSKDPEVLGKLKVHHYHIHRIEPTVVTSNGHGSGPSSEPNNGSFPDQIGSAGRIAANPTEIHYFLSEKHAFPTISEVIRYHKHNSGGLVVRLRTPPTKGRESPVTAGMGLDEFELDPVELQLEPDPIGKGQFGVVKRGRFRTIPVAVKQMVEGAMNEDDFIEEAKNMRFLNHPNLVQLFGVVLKKRPIMIITEYMKHGSLRDFMRQRKTLFANRPVVMADICAQVANGMAYLEQEQFVHRDLAARNCLVKSISRNSVHVKVADFGMARFLLDNVYEPSAGTKFPVRWAPPEVFQSTYTAKADIWSFGVLMWEVFTCCTENPYQGKNNTEVYQHIIHGGRLQKPAVCPQNLYVLMLECWQHDPSRRPAFEYICQKIGGYLDQTCEN